jgi:phosphate transport system protein
MGAYTVAALDTALHALFDRDTAAASMAIAGERQINALDNELHEECLKILVLHQPVAADLRLVCPALLVATDLERAGDLAGHIAEWAGSLTQ